MQSLRLGDGDVERKAPAMGGLVATQALGLERDVGALKRAPLVLRPALQPG